MHIKMEQVIPTPNNHLHYLLLPLASQRTLCKQSDWVADNQMNRCGNVERMVSRPKQDAELSACHPCQSSTCSPDCLLSHCLGCLKLLLGGTCTCTCSNSGRSKSERVGNQWVRKRQLLDEKTCEKLADRN